MKKLIIILSMVFLSGCGNISAPEVYPSGIFVDYSFGVELNRQFNEAVECTGIGEGEFTDISILIMPGSFSCDFYDGKCGGEFKSENLIKIGSVQTFKHELIHYFLWKNRADADAGHLSELFDRCG